MMILRSAKKAAAVILTVIMMVTALGGCSVVDKLQQQIDPKAEVVVSPELVRLLVTAINDQSKISSSYNDIPETQRVGISYSNYTEYIKILNQMSARNGRIKGFHFLSDDENDAHLEQIYTRLCQNVPTGSFESVFELYGKVRTVELEYSTDPEEPVYVYISQDSDGESFLSFNWIFRTIDIYNYIVHYFSSIENDNVQGVIPFVEIPGDIDETAADGIKNAKAEYTIDYYHDNVRKDMTKFSLVAVNAFFADYLVPQDNDRNEDSFRDVCAYKSADDVVIRDDIPQEVSGNITIVNLSAAEFLRCGLDYEYATIQRICGKPLSTYIGDEVLDVVKDENDKDVEKRRVVFQYRGLSLAFEAFYKDAKNWYGELVSIRLVRNNKKKYACNDISVGDPESAILARFPMVEYGDYTLNYSSSQKDYVIEFDVRDKVVNEIHIAVVKD